MKQIIILILILIIGCEYYCKPDIKCLTDYSFKEQIQVSTLEDCFKWTRYNITQKADQKDYAQTPEQTYQRNTGDCEDLCLMTQYLLYKIGIDSNLVRVDNRSTGGGHYVIKINDIYYEAIIYLPIENFNQKYKITDIIPYCEAVWMAKNYHYFWK